MSGQVTIRVQAALISIVFRAAKMADDGATPPLPPFCFDTQTGDVQMIGQTPKDEIGIGRADVAAGKRFIAIPQTPDLVRLHAENAPQAFGNEDAQKIYAEMEGADMAAMLWLRSLNLGKRIEYIDGVDERTVIATLDPVRNVWTRHRK